jgi:2-desacetyl-2-hydroxyethyl bacteriochlorophyllide A dehydrogenase
MAMVREAGTTELVERDVPPPGETQVLIAVRAASICGGDLHIYKGKHPSAPLPAALGHELAGEVVAVGAKVSCVAVGDRVTVEPVIACGQCAPCLRGEYSYCDSLSFHYRQGQGAMADYFTADERWVYKLPDRLSFEAGALIEPLAVAVHAVRRAGVGLGDAVAIIGAGPVGLLVAAVCKAAGAKEIIVGDVAEARLGHASIMGATQTVDARKGSMVDVVRRASGGRGVARSFECAGREETFEQSMRCLCKGGVATVVGIFEQPVIKVPVTLFVSQEITVQGSQGYCWDFERALLLTDTIDLGRLVSHRFDLADVDRAMKTALDPAASPVKVVVRP